MAFTLQAASRGPLNNGSGNEGEISAENPEDTWSFTAKAGENILLRFASTNFTGRMELFGPDGALLADDTGADLAIPPTWAQAFAVTESGTFKVVVSAANSSDTGSYRLNLAQPSKPWTVPAGKAGGALANGGNAGTLALGDMDLWSFTAKAGENILLRFASTNFSGRMELFGPDGASLVYHAGDDVAIPYPWEQAFAITNSGTFAVVVSGYHQGDTGSYRLNLAQPSKPWTVPAGKAGGALANGGNLGTLALGDMDFWSFTANAGENILLRFASTNFSGRMELFGPDGASLVVTSGTDTPIPATWAQAFALTNGGTFTVVVSASNSGDAGSYRLSFVQPSRPWTVPAGSQGGPLANGGNAGTLTLGNMDFWSFTANAGENLMVRFASSNFIGRLELFGPDGVSLSVGTGRDAAIPDPGASSFAVTDSGTFTVVVSAYESGGIGAYRLNLAQPSKPWTVPAGTQGGPLANGVNVGTLALGAMDFWSFTGKAGENVILRFASTNFTGRLELFGPDGASLMYGVGDDVAIPHTDAPSFVVTNSGTFTVVVSSYFSRDAGSYWLSLAQPSRPWSVPAGKAGGPLTNGVNVGTLALGAMDFWSFTAKAGENIILRLASTEFIGRMELFGPDGVSLAAIAGTDVAIPYPGAPSFAVTNGGTFTVVVSGRNWGEAGEYRLSLAQPSKPWTVPAGKEGGPLTNGVNVGTLALGAMDFWSFTAKAGESIILRFASTDFVGRLELFGPDGVPLAFTAGADVTIPDTGAPSLAVTNSGTFTVLVSGYNWGEAGSYRLSLAQPSKPWTVPVGKAGGPLTNGLNVGTLAPGAMDFWSFTAKAGESILLRMASADFNGRLELFGPDGVSLAFATGADVAIPVPWAQALTLTNGGTFTVLVSGHNLGGAGSYRLSLAQPSKPWPVPTGKEGGPLTNGVNVGTLALGGMDLWSFTAKAGENVLLRFASTHFTGRLELFGPDGVSLAYTAGADNAIPNTGAPAFTVTSGGTFTVVVSSYNWGGAGPYRLSLAQPSKPWTVPAGTWGGLLANGVNVGTLALGGMDLWSFAAVAGENVLLRFASTNFNGRMELFGPDGVSLGFDLGADVAIPCACGASFAVTNSGTFKVVVSSYNWGDAGPYRLVLAQPSKPWTVPAGHTGGPLASELNAGTFALGGMDFWSFTAKAGENIRLRFASAEFQGRLELFGPDGASLGYGTGADVSVPSTDAPSFVVTNSASFTVVVSSYNRGDAGSYWLRLAHLPESFVVPTGDEGGGLPDSVAGGWIGFGDQDTWKFTACKDEGFLVRLAPSANLYARLDLYGPEGNLLASAASRDEILIPQTATNCGTFSVVVTSYLSMRTGAYQLSVDGHSNALILCPPRVTNSQVNLTGAGGIAGAAFVLYTTTNITVPPVVWTPFATNRFDQLGVLDVNHAFDSDPPRYFRALMP